MTADHPKPLSELRDPVLVAAFEGWNDAGEAATTSIEHLELFWNAEQVREMVPDDYYDFQVNRPTVRLIDGVNRHMEWPTTTFSYCSPTWRRPRPATGSRRRAELPLARVRRRDRRHRAGRRRHVGRNARFTDGRHSPHAPGAGHRFGIQQ